jgi:hypothetical protein
MHGALKADPGRARHRPGGCAASTTKFAGSLRSVSIAKKTRTIADTTIADTTIAAIATEACAPVSARRR